MSKALKKSFEDVSVRLAHSFIGADEWVHDIIERLAPVWDKRDAWKECPYTNGEEKDRLYGIYLEECLNVLSYVDTQYGGCDAIYKKMKDDIRQRATKHQVPMEGILDRWKLGVRGQHRKREMPIAQIAALSVGMDHSYGHALHYLDVFIKERAKSLPAMAHE